MTTYVPPLNYVVGLDTGWADDRWFYSFDGQIGRPPQAVTLGYSTSQPRRRTALIKTEFPTITIAESLAAESAAISAFHLLISTAGISNAVTVMKNFTYDNNDWHDAHWTLNGSDVRAAVQRHSYGWCAFVRDGDARVIAVASSSEDLSQTISLSDLHNADDFNVNFLSPQEMSLIRELRPPAYVEEFGPLGGNGLNSPSD